MKTAICSGANCRLKIMWCWTEKGKRMPIDPDPDDRGTWFLDENTPTEDGQPVVHYFGPYHPDRQKMLKQKLLHMSHWATCVDARHF